MPVPKGYKRAVEIVRLTIGEQVTQEHVDAVALALRLRQTVTTKLGTHSPDANDATFVESCIVLEARPS